MKKIILLSVAVLFYITSPAQIKAIGNVNFGMDKKEVQDAVKADREAHSLTIGEGVFVPVLMSFKYENGLSKLVFNYKPNKNVTGLTATESTELIAKAETVLTNAGATILLRNDDLKSEHQLVAAMNEKAVVIYVAGGMRTSRGMEYQVSMKMITEAQYTAETTGVTNKNSTEAKSKL
jgi:hypothetical protein